MRREQRVNITTPQRRDAFLARGWTQVCAEALLFRMQRTVKSQLR
jgi:hypothetical protein